MKHLTVALLLSFSAASVPAQTAANETKPAEQAPPPSRGAEIQRQPNGIVVIKSSSAATQAARAKAAKDAEDAKKAEAKKAEDAKQGGGRTAAKSPAGKAASETDQTKAAEAQKPPKARATESYSYDVNGQRTSGVTSAEQNSDSSGQSGQTIVGTNGKRIPYITTQQKVISKSASRSVVEKQVQRYDTQGNPMRKAVVREEERKLPDGSIERTTTTYEQDVNGNLQPAERTIEREEKKGVKTTTVVTTERPSASGGFQTVEQKESVETKQGEKSSVETVVKRPTINGNLSESKREVSVTEKAGKTATTEKQVFERSTVSGEVSLSERSVGKTVEKPDGSSSETIQVYGYGRPGGGASDTNAGSGPRLVQSIQREKSKNASGETVETTTTRERGIADPSTLGEAKVVQKVSKPAAGGETVETNVSEEGVNGKLRPTQTTKEQIKK